MVNWKQLYALAVQPYTEQYSQYIKLFPIYYLYYIHIITS